MIFLLDYLLLLFIDVIIILMEYIEIINQKLIYLFFRKIKS